MHKYIDADDLKEQMVKYGWKHSDSTVHEFVDDLPSVDVRENIYGEWIKNDNGTYSCSLCQSWIPNEQYSYARFCLHCGANMRRKTNG